MDLNDGQGIYMLPPNVDDTVHTRRGEMRYSGNYDSRTLALAALGFGHAGLSDWAADGLSRLYGRAVVEPGMLHWVSDSDYRPGDIETTALALQATLKVNPQDPRVHDIVRWLMRERQGNYWYSTRDTAMTLYAMAEFLKVSKELSPDYDAVVTVNGKPVSKMHFGKASVFEPDRVLSVPAGSLRKGRNEITITKAGAGNVYYTASLTQYVAKERLTPVVTGAGVSVTRAYYKPGRAYEENGRAQDLGSVVSGCDSGDVILVKLTVNSSKHLDHLLLEDYLPAGCEVVDKGHLDYWDWDHWWVGRDIRDEKISFYLDSLSPGKHVVTYRMRASIPGDYRAMPAQVFAMYDPRVRATTAESEFEVR